jgi:SAM-dependent methyltransferase
MSSSYYQRRECRICKSDGLRLVLPLVATPSGDKYLAKSQLGPTQEVVPLDLYQCPACGLVQLPFVINPDALYGDYIYETSISLGLIKHFRGYAEEVVENLGLGRGDLVVDIGCNDGVLLGHFKDLGLRVIGVEPSPAGAKARNSGIDVRTAFFTEELSRAICSDAGPATVVTANNVFANVDNLDEFVRAVRQLLAPRGVFVFETFYLAEVLRNFLPETIFHEHLSYFSLSALKVLFARCGMEVFDAVRVATKGGSLRGFVQLAGAGRPESGRVAELLAAEQALGVSQPAVFASFSSTLKKTKQRLQRLLEGYKAQGKTVVGYGASVGVTTLLYQLDIAGYLDYLVDDNAAKQFRFSPGYRLSVLPSDTLYERRPDYVVVLAWAYADPIIARHTQFREQGGHFVVPLPDLKVV